MAEVITEHLETLRAALAAVLTREYARGGIYLDGEPEEEFADPIVRLQLNTMPQEFVRNTGTTVIDVATPEIVCTVQSLEFSGHPNALNCAMRLRRGLAEREFVDTLDAEGIALVGPPTAVRFVKASGRDGKRLPTYFFTFTLRCATAEADPAGPRATFAHVKVGGTLSPGPITVPDETIPPTE